MDVGASVGDVTKDLAVIVGPSGRVIAIEPAPANAEKIRARKLANVEVVEAALGRVNDFTTLYLDQAAGVHSLYAANRLKPEQSVGVLQMKLDSVAPKDLKFIKMDAQGSEFQILKGAKYTLERRPLAIWFELWEMGLRNAGSSSQEVCDLLEKAGFTAMRNTDTVWPWPEVVREAVQAGQDSHSAIDVWCQAV